jgi:hypothetical protein
MVKFSGDPELVAAYAASDGLCAPHLLRAIELASSGGELARLVEQTLRKWSVVHRDLTSFVRKHDYRHREPLTAAETEACLRAFEVLAGAERLFGSDLRRRRGGEAPRGRLKPGSEQADIGAEGLSP